MKKAVASTGFRIAWIWALPVAALGIVLWIGARALTQGGPTVVVTFANAGSVKAGNTTVTFKDMQVGEVVGVKLHKDLAAADVTLAMDADMSGHLGPGTRFWISGQTIELNNPSTIKSLIAGPRIELDPHDGPTQHHVTGLNEAPVLKQEPAGTRFVLSASKLGSISRGAPVYYRGLEVGEVQGYTFDPPDTFRIYAFVKAPYAKLVHVGSHFWDASAAHLSMGPGGPSFSLVSPSALITGAIGFDMSQDAAGPVAPANTTFTLYDSKDSAEYAPADDAVTYSVTLDDAQAVALDTGAPVQLEGRRIGSVTQVEMRFSPNDNKLLSDVTIAVEPNLLHIANAPPGKGRPRMDAILTLMVGQGLRAQLGSTTPVVGAKDIELRFVPGVRTASLLAGSPPGIPTAAGGDIGQIMHQVSDVAGKLDSLPLAAIGDEVHDATARLAELSQSAELKQTLEHLDQSVSNINDVTRQARLQVRPLLEQVRHATEQADRAVTSAQSLIGGRGGLGPEQAGLPQALYELTQAARSLRQLADLLARDPNALVFGRSR